MKNDNKCSTRDNYERIRSIGISVKKKLLAFFLFEPNVFLIFVSLTSTRSIRRKSDEVRLKERKKGNRSFINPLFCK